jgi:hypothetical protein
VTNQPFRFATAKRASPLMPAPDPNAPIAVQADDLWPRAEQVAVPVLLKYMPEATQNQKNAATHLVHFYWDNRAQWKKEHDQIRGRLEACATLSEPAKTELSRVHDVEWQMFQTSVTNMLQTFESSNEVFFKKHGFSDPNLQSDLMALAMPPGKEPWEE